MDILVGERTPNGIPVLELRPRDGRRKRPVVLLFHGYLGMKEFILAQAYHIARNGYFVLVPDAFGHGSRASGNPPGLLQAILETAADADRILDAYASHPQADVSRLGLAGYSMGGCIVYHYLVEGKRKVSAAIPVISTPEWTAIVDGFDHPAGLAQLRQLGLLGETEDLAVMRELAKRVQPIDHPERMVDVPLLMLNGAKDTVTPPEGAARLFAQLIPRYADKSRLRHVLYEDAGHGDTLSMNLELLEWLKQYCT